MDTILKALVLLNLARVICFTDPSCNLPTSELEGIHLPGDIMLGAVVPIHIDKITEEVTFQVKPPETTCTLFNLISYQHFQAMVFAIELINGDPSILPNITLGFQAYDSCDVLQLDLKGSLQALTGSNVAIPNYRCLSDIPLGAVIGAAVSTHSVIMAHILGLYRYPQISHLSTMHLLSDRKTFPSFFRTVPSDTFQSVGLAKLILHFGWTWIGLVAMDNDYGQQGIQLVKQEISKHGVCVAFNEKIVLSQADRNAPHIVNIIRHSTAKVVVAFSLDIHLVPILEEMLKQNITDRVFVASEALSGKLGIMERFSKIMEGTVGLALQKGTIPGFGSFINSIHPSMPIGNNWIEEFWELAFSCRIKHDENSTDYGNMIGEECTGREEIRGLNNAFTDVSSLRTTYHLYMAVHVVAQALEDMNICKKTEASSPGQCMGIDRFRPWKLLQYMKRVRVRMSNGRDLYFNENGDPPAFYDIVNWQLSPEGAVQHVIVGSYDTSASSDRVFTINSTMLLWTDKSKQVPPSACSGSCPVGFWKAARRGQPDCCFDCIPCPPGEIANSTDSVSCWKCPWEQWPSGLRSKCLPKPFEYLSYEDSLGAGLAVLASISSLVPDFSLRLFIKHKSSPIVKASNYLVSCLLLLSLSFCFLCSLVFIGHPQREMCLLQQVTFGLVFALCVSCILAKTIMVVFAFMATKPSSRLRKWATPRVSYMIIFIGFIFQLMLCVFWLFLKPPFLQYNTHTKPGLIIVECNEGSPVAFWTMLGYLFLLATISFVVAFLARRLPDRYNEAQYITFSMLAFLSVWISYIPASLSAQGKYTVAMEIFAILASSWALVICMFLPKCFIIIFRPKLNTREKVMRNDVPNATMSSL